MRYTSGALTGKPAVTQWVGGREVVQFLELRWNTAGQTRQPPVVELSDIVAAICRPEAQVRAAIARLEAVGDVRCVRRHCGDPNPIYYVTDQALRRST